MICLITRQGSEGCSSAAACDVRNYKDLYSLIRKKAFLIVALLPVVAIAGYVLYLWNYTIHDSVYEGTKYGFTIGEDKADAHVNLLEWRKLHPELILITYAKVDGHDQEQLVKLSLEFEDLQKYNQWRVHLNGEMGGSNSIRLTFENDSLKNIYRHRQYYELP